MTLEKAKLSLSKTRKAVAGKPRQNLHFTAARVGDDGQPLTAKKLMEKIQEMRDKAKGKAT